MDKCNCDKSEEPQKEDNTHDCSMSLKNKKHKISLTSLGFNFRKVRSKRSAKKSNQTFLANPLAKTNKESSRKSSKNIFSKFNCTKKETKVAFSQDDLVTNCCTCLCSQKTEESEAGPSCASEYNIDRNTCTSVAAVHKCTELDKIQPVEQTDNYNSSENGIVLQQAENSNEQETARAIYGIHGSSTTIIVNGSCTGSSCDMPCDIRWIRTVHQDCDETARLNRAREIEQGVEAPANFKPVRRIQLFCSNIDGDEGSQRVVVYPSDVNVDTLKSLFHDTVTLQVSGVDSVAGCHTQVDFIHCLVPDMFQITQCSFYWGKMDRYEAEKLLDGKPEGTFLLRDSAQEEFLFSVSFRKYNRSLHARVEQWNHKFSFDAHDPGVFTSDTICGLMEHYKDPSSCMFFEPMLSYPLNRSFPFSLQHLCRAVIVNRLSYDNITNLSLPKSLKSYLKEYHYKQKVRVERFDEDIQVLDIRDTNNGHKDSFSSISKIV